MPSNITTVPLPAKGPVLNSVENVWRFLGDNGLTSRVFGSDLAIVDPCSDAWNMLTAQPWRVMSIVLR